MRPLDPRLLHRATAARFFLVAVAVVGLLTALLVLAQAWFLSQAVAFVFDTHDTSLAVASVPVLVAIFAARGLLTWANAVLAQRASAQVKSQLRTDVAAARLARPGDTTITSTSVSTLVSTELDALDGYFAKYLPQLVLAVVVPVVMVAAIAWQDWPSALIILATIPLIPVFMILIGWTTREQVARRFRVQNRLANHFADLVAGLVTLQVFGRARGQVKGLAGTEDASRTQTMATLRIAFLSAGVLEMAATLSVAIVAVTLGFRVIDGGMDLATSLFVLMLAPEAYLPIRQVGVHFHDSANGQAAADAAFAVIEDAEAHADAGAGTPARVSDAALVLDDVSFSYPGADQPALSHLSVRVAPGRIVALAGPSGGGKSTALQLVMGFLTPSEGRVLVGPDDLTTLDHTAWRRQLAWVGQDPGMVRGTIADNVRLGHPGASTAQVRSALDRVGGPLLAADRPVGDDGEGLSAGERRRVAMARALLRIELGGARLLVADEPTAGLDPATEAQAVETVRGTGAAALIVSHRPAVLAMADEVITVAEPAAIVHADKEADR